MSFDAKDFLPRENGLADNGQPWEYDPLPDWEGPATPDAFYARPEFQGRISPTPIEGLEMELMMLFEYLPAPFFQRPRPCFVQVCPGDYREDVPTTQVDGRLVYSPLALGLGY